jgi:uracil-DNA glycosylase family protein
MRVDLGRGAVIAAHPIALPVRPRTLAQLRVVARTCASCGRCEGATQTVLGSGPAHARLAFVGEHPDAEEDRVGRPFVGAVGAVLDDACRAAGIDRASVYVTNAVKHSRVRTVAKRPVITQPNGREIEACRTWWRAELDLVKPDVVVCFGAIAARAVLGRARYRVERHRGEWHRVDNRRVIATVHPAAVLRAGKDRGACYSDLVDDLALVAGALDGVSSSRTRRAGA